MAFVFGTRDRDFLPTHDLPTTPKHPDSLLVKRLLRLTRLAFRPSPTSIRYIYPTLILISIIREFFSYQVGITLSRFYVVIPNRNLEDLLRLIGWCLLFFFGLGVALGATHYAGGVLALRARQSIATWLHAKYLRRGALYEVLYGHNGIDNPDMRITQDLDKFCEQLRKVIEDLTITPLLLIYYTYQTYLIAGPLAPLTIYTFFLTTFLLSRYILRPLASLVAKRERAEGDLRYLHVHVRTEAESIAMMRGEEAERRRLDGALEVALGVQGVIVGWEAGLKVVTSGISYVGSMLPYCLIAVPIFRGEFEGLPK
ncbi:ATP-binding cassette sub- D member 4 [Rhizophlyctis rosea]|nr:ATP-binding cassette sub- D member 4 [Rhizophlyctis rosea]